MGVLAFVLTSETEPGDSQKASKEKKTKAICSTNVAESSLTLGIDDVIDLGLQKEPLVNGETGLETLLLKPVSQRSAKQRAGRAGRLDVNCLGP